jgi:tRNA(Ile)-lysidine synthase
MSARAVADLLVTLRERADFSAMTPPVVVACSGGADSLALLVLAVDAGLEPVAVHVDHGLRAGSGTDAFVVADAADRVGATSRTAVVDVTSGPNLEARARDARYRALEAARAGAGAEWVLTAHTADDQAETVLLNILRGAASAGLAGMPARRELVARPILGLRRAETRELCSLLGLQVVDDPMNDDPAFARVAMRRRVLPLLEEIAGRDLVPVLTRQAEVLRAESDFLDDLARAVWPGECAPLARALAALDPVLAQRAVRIWLGPPPPSRAEVARVLQVARGQYRATQLAGGRAVRRSKGLLTLERE